MSIETNQEEVRQKLDSQIDALNAKIDQQDKLSNKYQLEAKAKLKAKDKKGAQQALVKKKRCVKQIKEWEGALGLLEQQKMMLENAGMMKNIVDTVKNTNQAIHEAQGKETCKKIKLFVFFIYLFIYIFQLFIFIEKIFILYRFKY